MDPRKNPYAPGAGTPPPELAGRDDLIERAAIALDRIRARRAARSLILHGVRGVGKTVLLNRIEIDAEARSFACVKVEAPEQRSLPALLIPALRMALLRLDRGRRMRANLAKAGRALAGFAKALKLKYKDIEVSTDFEPERGLAVVETSTPTSPISWLRLGM
jgi:AAA ATPase domain